MVDLEYVSALVRCEQATDVTKTTTMRPSEIQFLAVYGTLRRRCQFRQGYLVTRSLKFFGQGLLRGLRLAQCGYPAILEQPGLVHVELFRVLQESIWPILDRYEGYKPEIGSYSLFIRKAVVLVRPRICAWVYFIGREIPRGRPV